VTKPTAAGDDHDLFASGRAADAWQRGEASRDDLLGPATALMLDLAGVGPGARVLDLAAGTGAQTLLAARRVGPTGAVLATDVAAPMLDRAAAEARLSGLDWVATRVMDAHDLALEDADFDAAICRQGLMYLADLERALAGVRRVRRPGGRLAALVWARAERNPALAAALAVGHRHAGPASPPPERVTMFALGDPDALAGAYARAGFRDVAAQSVATLRRYPSAADAARDQRVSFVALHPYFAGLGEPERERAWAEVARALRRFEGPDGYAAPGEVLVAVGTR